MDHTFSNSSLNSKALVPTILNIPIEILNEIFSYLDGTSKKNASPVCKVWFAIIRTNRKISNHICFGNYGPKTLNELQRKIDKSEWIWERWPMLKTLEFGGCTNISASQTTDSIKKFNFDQCPPLEKVVLNVDFDLEEISPNCRRKIATVKQLTFDPKMKIESIDMKNITFLILHGSNFDFCNTLKFIGETAKNLNCLDIELEPWSEEVFEKGFTPMFQGLSDSLQTVNLDMDIRISDYDLSCELLKTLSENCSKLANLRFNLRFNHSRPLPIVKNCFKQLKMLIVPELKFIDALISDTNSLTKLFIEQATMDELRNFDLSTIGKKFKKLKKCYINVRPGRYTGQYFSKRRIVKYKRFKKIDWIQSHHLQ